MPAMTVGAPKAELDLDLTDLDRVLESGVAAGVTMLSSPVGVWGSRIEFDRE